MKNSKWVVWILVVTLVMAMTLTGCTPKDNSGDVSEQQVDLICAASVSMTSTQAKGLAKFADLVKERTNGTVTISVYTDGQLGGEREIFEGQGVGSIDIGLYGASGIGAASTVIKAMLSGPYFGLKDFESADKAFYGATGSAITSADGGFWGKVMAEEFEKNNVVYLGVWDNGFRGISNSKHPVTCADDVKNLKLRTPESEGYMKFFGALGAICTPMAVSELYTALQQGTVDGQDNGITYSNAQGYGEVQKYYTEVNYMYGALLFGISNTALEKVPEKYRDTIIDAALEAAIYHNQIHREDVANAKKHMEEQGVSFYTLSAAERQTFIDATESVRDWQYEQVGEEYAKMWRDFMSSGQ